MIKGNKGLHSSERKKTSQFAGDMIVYEENPKDSTNNNNNNKALQNNKLVK